MAFPVTLNGRTYTLADFSGTSYVEGFPDALEDFVTQAGNIYTTTSTSSVAIGTGSKTFTVADSGKPYIVGTPLRIADAAAPATNWIDGIVTSYSGTTLVVNAVAYAGSGTISSWNINIGGGPIAYTGTLPVAQGGTGATTEAAARTNLDVYSKSEADSRFLNVSGEASNVTMTGDVTIGDTSGDTLTVNATATFSGNLTVDTDTLFVNAATNRVGIGTVSPSHELDIQVNGGAGVVDVRILNTGTNVADDAILRLAIAGTTAQSNIYFADGDSTSVGRIQYDHTDDNMEFFTSGTQKVTIDSSGNLDVAGTITSDGLTVDGTSSLNGDITMNTGTPQFKMYSPSSVNGYDFTANVSDAVDGGLNIRDISGKQLVQIKSNNDISFYEDTGTTPEFFWDASAERLGIGTTSPSQALDVVGNIEVSGGIYLGGTASTNLLDDYEEGAWTAEIYDAATGGNDSATTATGYYTKVGRIVTATANFSNINTTGMTAGNAIYLTLPFTNSVPTVGSIRLYANVDDSTVSLAAFAGSSAPRATIQESRDNGTLQNVAVGDLISGSSDLTFTITYQV